MLIIYFIADILLLKYASHIACAHTFNLLLLCSIILLRVGQTLWNTEEIEWIVRVYFVCPTSAFVSFLIVHWLPLNNNTRARVHIKCILLFNSPTVHLCITKIVHWMPLNNSRVHIIIFNLPPVYIDRSFLSQIHIFLQSYTFEQYTCQ